MASSLVVFVVAWYQRNPLPSVEALTSQVRSEPAQKKTRTRPSEINFNGVTYEIAPEYDYDISGVIVSYRHHDGESRLHRLANDHLNMLDVCLVWGDNAGNPALDKIKFWNGVFTCNAQTRDQAAWDAFDMNQLSNNHLISADSFVRDKLGSIKVGDQIRVRGVLTSYGPKGQSKRGTSTTRTDTGNGACETILVEEVEILNASFSNWRLAMYVAAAMLLLSLLVHFFSPHRPHRS